jgi:hypothetical protein
MALLTAGKTWGQYQLATGEIINVQDISEQVYYDSDIIAAAPGQTEYVFCRNANFSTGALKTLVLTIIYQNGVEFQRIGTSQSWLQVSTFKQVFLALTFRHWSITDI